MTNTQSRIRELIARNVVLKKSVKDDILAAPDDKQAEILPLLEAMDTDQTKMMRKVIKKDPDFFENLDAAASETELSAR